MSLFIFTFLCYFILLSADYEILSQYKLFSGNLFLVLQCVPNVKS